jgi:hypothetical protein
MRGRVGRWPSAAIVLGVLLAGAGAADEVLDPALGVQ